MRTEETLIKLSNKIHLSQNQSYTIQILRGVAIIAVVFIHNTPAGLTQVFCRPFLNFCVGLFLFLSGILSDSEKWHPKKRIIKVLIPYVIWTIIYVILNNCQQPVKIPINIVVCLLTGKASAQMYYIFVYCELTLLIPIIDKLARSKYKLLGFVISPLEIIIMRLMPQLIGFEMNKYINIIMSVSCLGWFTYFYLGYLLGNGLIKVKISKLVLILSFFVSIIVQMAEGYWYYLFGNQNCGTQLKLSSVLTGCIVCIVSYKLIKSEKCPKIKIMYIIGDCSFGIYFSHMAIMSILNYISFYATLSPILFPIKAIVILMFSLCFVLAGKKVLGKHSKYLAL